MDQQNHNSKDDEIPEFQVQFFHRQKSSIKLFTEEKIQQSDFMIIQKNPSKKQKQSETNDSKLQETILQNTLNNDEYIVVDELIEEQNPFKEYQQDHELSQPMSKSTDSQITMLGNFHQINIPQFIEEQQNFITDYGDEPQQKLTVDYYSSMSKSITKDLKKEMKMQSLNEAFGVSKNPLFIFNQLNSEQRTPLRNSQANSDNLKTHRKSSQQSNERSSTQKKDSNNNTINTNQRRNKWLKLIAISELKQQQRKSFNCFGTAFVASNVIPIHKQKPFQIFPTIEEEGGPKQLIRQRTQSFGFQQNDKFETIKSLTSVKKQMSTVDEEGSQFNLLKAQTVPNQQTSSESFSSVEYDQSSSSSSSFIGTKTTHIKKDNPYGKNKMYIGLEMKMAQQKEKNEDETMNINQKDMRQVLKSNFGVNIKFPANYNDQALIVPHLPDLIMCTCYHIVPKSKAVLETNKLDGSVVQNYFSNTYKQNTGKSVLIRLLQANGRYGFQMLNEFQLKGINKCLIQFSKSGRYFSICLKTKNKLFIYDSTDIIMCCQKIRHENADIIIEIPEEMDFGLCQRVVFDKNDNFVSLVSERSVFIYSLAQGKTLNPIIVYRLDEEQYCEINDFIIDSKGCPPGEAKCVIACKVTHLNQIQIFELKNPKANKKISFLKPTKTGVKLVVKISDDMTRVILSTGNEHYLHTGISQENFPWIKDKFIRSVINDGHDFFLVTSKDYDRDVDILHSSNNEFNSSIKRRFEPGMLTLYDSIKYVDNKEDSGIKSKSKGYLKILMKVGDSMFLDTINIDLCYDENIQQYSHINSTSFKYYSAYSFNWPYFSFANYYGEVLVFNAFNTLLIQKFIMPQIISKIHHTFLTDTHDLFIFCETTDQHFEQYTVDLDSDNPILKGPICRYSFSLVEEDQCIAYHVRGSSHKEKINLNHQLLTYMMHGTSLYFWNGAIKQIRLISQDSSNMCYLNDDTFLYMTTEEQQLGNRTFQHSNIIMIESRFGAFQKTEIYKDQDLRAEILTFGVDIQSQRLLILTGIKNLKEKRDKWVIIYDIKTEKLLYRVQIESREIIGRMKSNLYVFIDGHIYYGNKVIKIRYDLLERFKGREIKENILFNYYDSVLDLKPNQSVQSGTPLQSCVYNRLAYVIRNNQDFTSRTLLILPYLHERRIYLNRRQSANQFYTVVNRDEINYILCLCVDHNKIYLYTETGLLIDKIPYEDIVEIYGKPEGISENGQNFVFRKSELSPEINIMRLELEGIFFRHSINVIKEFGEYVSDPNNRDKSISQNIEQDQKNLKKLSEKQQKDLKVFWDYYLNKCQNLRKVQLKYFLNDSGDVLFQLKPQFSKTKNFNKLLKKVKLQQNTVTDEDEIEQSDLDKEEKEVEGKNLEIKSDSIQKKFEELAKEKIQNLHRNDQDHKDMLQKCNLFYFKAGTEQENDNIQEFFYFDGVDDEIQDLKGVSMNEDYIFFWNLNIIWKMSLKTKKLTKIQIQISNKESQTMIKRVRTGSDESIVTIRIQLSAKKDCIVIWDLANEREIENFDIDSDALYFQDAIGNPYILEKDYVIMCKDGCRLRCFKAKLSMFDTENTRFSFPQGYRIEPKSHNWVVFRNFINLSFSYMTFVIKEHTEKVKHNHVDYFFDLEGYDFILQHKTIFTDENKTLVTQDYDKLSYILKNYYEINPMLLESLHYPNEQGELPIHIAIKSNNHRMVNLILNYMSRIEYAAVKQLKNIFSQLIMFNGFEEYLSYCPFQTNQMVNKQTLKLQFREEKEIMAVEPSSSSYVDELYFRDVMGEKEQGDNCRTYAVKIVQIRADWILNSEDGLIFLREILRQGNKDLLMSNYVKIIIQFLFNRYSEKITKYNVPPYIIHLIAVIMNIIFSEQYRIMQKQAQYNPDIYNQDEIDHRKYISQVFEYLCLACVIHLLIMFLRQTWYLGKSCLTRGWTILDIIIIVLNFLICRELSTQDLSENVTRIYQAFLVLCMFIKSLYFLRLDSRISPLVDSVFTILIEIKHFLIVYFILLAGFIAAFYNVGQAQCSLILDMQGNEDTTECSNKILYYGMIGAISHVWESALGGFQDASYSLQPQTKYIVWILFFLLSFFMQIHLLNMLIAMMGESFQQNNEIKESKKQMSQLSFVVDNWFIDPIQNKNKIVYIVAAFLTEEQDNEIEKFEQIKNSINDMNKIQKEGITEIRQIQSKIHNLSTILYQQQSLIDQENQLQKRNSAIDKKSQSSKEANSEQSQQPETNDVYKKLKV